MIPRGLHRSCRKRKEQALFVAQALFLLHCRGHRPWPLAAARASYSWRNWDGDGRMQEQGRDRDRQCGYFTVRSAKTPRMRATFASSGMPASVRAFARDVAPTGASPAASPLKGLGEGVSVA